MKKSLIAILALSAFGTGLFADESAIYCVNGKIRTQQSHKTQSSLDMVKERYPKADIRLIEGGFKDITTANRTASTKYGIAGDPCPAPGATKTEQKRAVNFTATCYDLKVQGEVCGEIKVYNKDQAVIKKMTLNDKISKNYANNGEIVTYNLCKSSQGPGLTCDKVKSLKVLSKEGGEVKVTLTMGGEDPFQKEVRERDARGGVPSGGYDGNRAKKERAAEPNPMDMMKKIF